MSKKNFDYYLPAQVSIREELEIIKLPATEVNVLITF